MRARAEWTADGASRGEWGGLFSKFGDEPVVDYRSFDQFYTYRGPSAAQIHASWIPWNNRWEYVAPDYVVCCAP
jgi:hypothetical protein